MVVLLLFKYCVDLLLKKKKYCVDLVLFIGIGPLDALTLDRRTCV